MVISVRLCPCKRAEGEEEGEGDNTVKCQMFKQRLSSLTIETSGNFCLHFYKKEGRERGKRGGGDRGRKRVSESDRKKINTDAHKRQSSCRFHAKD